MDEAQFANEYYRKYKEGEFSECSPSYAYMTYDILNKRGMIHLSEVEKDEYRVQAQIEVEMRYSKVKDGPVKISDLLDASTVIGIDETTAVSNIAKGMVILDLFEAWKAEGRTRIIQ